MKRELASMNADKFNVATRSIQIFKKAADARADQPILDAGAQTKKLARDWAIAYPRADLLDLIEMIAQVAGSVLSLLPNKDEVEKAIQHALIMHIEVFESLSQEDG